MQTSPSRVFFPGNDPAAVLFLPCGSHDFDEKA
jgi:hypothetical protein